MSADKRQPDPRLPPETPCVECGKRKDEHIVTQQNGLRLCAPHTLPNGQRARRNFR